MRRSLARYREKRDFDATPEPSGTPRSARAPTSISEAGLFVVQRHEATRLHFDFRLELDGVLVSWAVPREPSMSVGVRRLAVRTEDHPREYAHFHGDIPEGQYGAGHVQIWDKGTWRPVGDPREGLERGHLKFALDGERLRGRFVLIRMKSRGERQENWLLIRERDAEDVAAAPAQRTRAARATPRSARKRASAGGDGMDSGRERATRRRSS